MAIASIVKKLNLRLPPDQKRAVLVLVGLGLIMLGVGLWNIGRSGNLMKTVQIGSESYRLNIVSEKNDLKKGLGGIESMPEKSGMLFVFEQKAKRCMWMKDMVFSIDILWIDSQAKVVDIQTDISPATYPESFCGAKPTRYVIELNAGQVQSSGVKVGDTIKVIER